MFYLIDSANLTAEKAAMVANYQTIAALVIVLLIAFIMISGRKPAAEITESR